VVNVNREDAIAAVQRLTGGRGVQYVLECSGAPNALNEAARMVNRGGRICLAAFPHEPVSVDLAYIVRNNIYVFGISAAKVRVQCIERLRLWGSGGSMPS
jgi:threonine dehydrogenase-like Zn-dependent dehydrogenase